MYIHMFFYVCVMYICNVFYLKVCAYLLIFICPQREELSQLFVHKLFISPEGLPMAG